MRNARLMVLLLAVLVLGLVLSGCGETAQEKGYSTQKEAIEAYCAEEGIDIPELTVSAEKNVSVQDPDWEVNYAFPAEAEGEGDFFLLHKTSDGWTVIDHTEKLGWTAEELKEFGAPTDIVVDITGSST